MPMNNSPPSLLSAKHVRHPKRRFADLGGVVESPSAALDVNRIRDVRVNAFQQVLAVKPAFAVPGGSPLKTWLDRGPALLVGAPAAKDRHIVPVRPQALVRSGVALDKSPEGIQELLSEFVPVRHARLLVRPSMLAGSCHRNDLLLRRSRHIVQDRPMRSVR